MIYPSINEIMKAKNIDSKYTLVIATAKRAREINQTNITFSECKSDKAVTIALHEIAENKINFKNADDNKPVIVSDTVMNPIFEEELAANFEDSLAFDEE